MNVPTDGLSILLDNWQMILVILLIISISQFTIHSALKKIFGETLSSDEYFSLATAGWLFPASLISILWYFLSSLQVSQIGIIIILIIYIFSQERKKISFSSPQSIIWALFGVLGISIILRLAYVSKAIIPLYFDSAQHYLYIKNIIDGATYPTVGNTLTWPTTNYYHLGFHILVAFLSATLHMEIKTSMLIMGQVILAVIPISVFFMIKHETGSNSAGFLSVLLAGFGWYMPAHAVDWGKYPALTSLSLIQFVLSIAYLSTQTKSSLPTNKRQWLNIILAMGIVISIFFHSRSLIVFGVAFLAWKISSLIKRLSQTHQLVIIFITMLGISLEIILIQRKNILKPLLDPYINIGLLVTIIILALLPFAIKFYQKTTFACLVGIFILIISIFIPITGLPGYGTLTLLDRPFVEMILYLPLSLLGGLGLAGLFQYVRQNANSPLAKITSPLLIGLVLINAYINYDFYPSDCCKIVGSDDLTAIGWMDKNLPVGARILISTTDLLLLPFASSQGTVGADAGIWISPLINRQTLSMSYSSNFGQRETLDILCKRGVNYIYVGEIGQTFDDGQIRSNTAWYKALLSMPKAGVYQIIGCD